MSDLTSHKKGRKNAKATLFNSTDQTQTDVPTFKVPGRCSLFSDEARKWVAQFHSDFDKKVAGLKQRGKDVTEWEDKLWVSFHEKFRGEMVGDPPQTSNKSKKSWKDVSELLYDSAQRSSLYSVLQRYIFEPLSTSRGDIGFESRENQQTHR